eukprot:7148684-Prymnesium_polylepis.1
MLASVRGVARRQLRGSVRGYRAPTGALNHCVDLVRCAAPRVGNRRTRPPVPACAHSLPCVGCARAPPATCVGAHTRLPVRGGRQYDPDRFVCNLHAPPAATTAAACGRCSGRSSTCGSWPSRG